MKILYTASCLMGNDCEATVSMNLSEVCHINTWCICVNTTRIYTRIYMKFI